MPVQTPFSSNTLHTQRGHNSTYKKENEEHKRGILNKNKRKTLRKMRRINKFVIGEEIKP